MMNAIIERLERTGNWKLFMRSACKMNNICTSLAGELTPGKLRLLIQRFKKAYDGNQDGFAQSWIEHEMRAFNWIVIAVSAEKNVKIAQFGPSQWLSLQQIFDKKSESFLKYETRRFVMERSVKNKNWKEDENELLRSILFDPDKIVWNEVARKLFELSKEKYFRTAKHCREHWLNYLDPSKQRGDWTKEQDLKLLQKVQIEGKRWSKLGALFNRTEHNVKNRYNALLTKQKRITPHIRQDEILVEAVKKSITELPDEVQPLYQTKNSMKIPSEENLSQHKSEPVLMDQLQPKISILTNPNYSLVNVEGRDLVNNFLKQDQDEKNQGAHFGFWAQSPKSITPIGFSPSPFSFSLNPSYYFHNFTQEMQKNCLKEDSNNQ